MNARPSMTTPRPITAGRRAAAVRAAAALVIGLAVAPALVAGAASAQPAPADSPAVSAPAAAGDLSGPAVLPAAPTDAAGAAPADAAGAGAAGADAAGSGIDAAPPFGEDLAADGELPAAASRSHLPTDLSPWGMFLAADIVVKAVMIGLAFASVVTWTVALAKSFELGTSSLRLRRGRAVLAGASGLADAAEKAPEGAAGLLVAAAVTEVRLSSGLSAAGIKERVASRLERVEAVSGRALRRGTGVLATIGATATRSLMPSAGSPSE